MGKFLNYIRESWAELKKVTWPSMPETVTMSVVVLFIVALFAIFFFAVDSIIIKLMQIAFAGRFSS